MTEADTSSCEKYSIHQKKIQRTFTINEPSDILKLYDFHRKCGNYRRRFSSVNSSSGMISSSSSGNSILVISSGEIQLLITGSNKKKVTQAITPNTTAVACRSPYGTGGLYGCKQRNVQRGMGRFYRCTTGKFQFAFDCARCFVNIFHLVLKPVRLL